MGAREAGVGLLRKAWLLKLARPRWPATMQRSQRAAATATHAPLQVCRFQSLAAFTSTLFQHVQVRGIQGAAAGHAPGTIASPAAEPAPAGRGGHPLHLTRGLSPPPAVSQVALRYRSISCR